MTTYWLLGETSEEGNEVFQETDPVTEEYDEDVDYVDDVSNHTTVTFHVSHHDSEQRSQASRTS